MEPLFYWKKKTDVIALLQEVREMKSLAFVQQPCQLRDLVTSLIIKFKAISHYLKTKRQIPS